MKAFSKNMIQLIVLCVITSCIESINLDLPSDQERLVVFGWVTNQSGPYEINISKTNEFNSTEPYEVVSGATVYVFDRLQNRFDFVEQGSSGTYWSIPDFVGIANESYEMHIETLEGNHIVSTRETLKPLPNVVSTFIQFFLNPEEIDIGPEDDNWYLAGLIDDTPDIENYYRWKLYVNDNLRNSPDELVLFDDRFTDGNIFRFDASNVLFKEGDKVRLVNMSLSNAAYNYYKQLKNLSGSDITGPAFQFFPLEGNMVDVEQNVEILGFFGTSVIETIQVQ